MNNSNPLVPEGSLDQKNKGRARLKIAVFVFLSIHALGLLALLMQGCKQNENPPPPPSQEAAAPAANEAPTFEATTNQTAADTNLPPAGATAEPTNPPQAAESQPAMTPAPVPVPGPAPTPAPAPAASGTEYTVAKGDTLGSIAKKSGVSIKALTNANPGVQPTKLKIGQKLQIPAASAAVASASGGAAPAASESSGSAQAYTVKSGDSLSKIAGHFGVSVKAVRAANSLKTDSIKVGQKLKIPVKTSAAASTSAPAPAAPVPTPEPIPAPAPTPNVAAPAGQ